MKLNKIYLDDCLDVMQRMKDNCIDTIITDPPYGLSFMGKKWDYEVPGVELWQECLRVLKPGGTALIFAGSRTQHRMAVNVEDAGFILKDCLMWLYGSGFPKATDISKQIDKKAGAVRKVLGANPNAGRKAVLSYKKDGRKTPKPLGDGQITAPATPEAQQWDGWKSHGLKPAYEPILVAVKPNDGTYANNALKWGVSGLNINGGRIKTDDKIPTIKNQNIKNNSYKQDNSQRERDTQYIQNSKGRFPANVILDEESAELLDRQTGILKNGAMKKNYEYKDNGNSMGKATGATKQIHEANSGGASRFFYCAKTSKKERGEGNNHPTVKPLKLIEYLCKLTRTPTGGIVLDPFAGSGTTGIAAQNTNRKFILIEKEPNYWKIANSRLRKNKIRLRK